MHHSPDREAMLRILARQRELLDRLQRLLATADETRLEMLALLERGAPAAAATVSTQSASAASGQP